MKYGYVLATIAAALMIMGCEEYREIPAGYIGKVLTPTGWEKGIREAGQVDIQAPFGNGTYNTLVLLEATSVAIKEHFGKADANQEDDRVIIGKTPSTVDFYVRCMVGTDLDIRNAIFAQITPRALKENERVSVITVEMIYAQFAKMDVRSGVRRVLSKYPDIYYVQSHLDSVNDAGATMVISAFKASGVPLLMQNSQFSNIKMDETVWAAENQKQAALAQVEAITKIGQALRANPEYMLFKKYDTYKEIAAQQKEVSFTIIDGQPNGIVVK
jgi:hypothetical protein